MGSGLSYPGGPNAIGVLTRGEGGRSQYPIGKKDPRKKKFRQPLEAGKGKETDFPVVSRRNLDLPIP